MHSSKFIKRIAIIGPESVGKSTLTKNISNRLSTNFVPEYGRLIYKEKNYITINNFISISKGRKDLEDWMIKFSNKYLICDTEDVTMYISSKIYCNQEYSKIEKYLSDKIEKSIKYDIYILLKPDCKVVKDVTRSLQERNDHYNAIKSELDLRDLNYIEVGGTWIERYKISLEAINSLD